jgi:hypothetical protein
MKLKNQRPGHKGAVEPAKKKCYGDVWESEAVVPPFLNSALNGGERSVSHPGRYTPSEMVPGTNLIG